MLEVLKLPNKIKTKLVKDDFKVVGHLGEGAFGEVSKVIYLETGHEYAMKKIGKEDLDEAALERLQNEIEHQAVLTGLPYICSIWGVFEDNYYIYIVQELCGKELYKLSRNKSYWETVSLEQKIRWFHQLVIAIDSCHRAGIIHLDIKTENVLIDKNDDISLIDFGLSQYVDKLIGNTVGTIDYLAPELLDDRNPIITPAADCWALGVFLYEIICGHLPFMADTISQIEKNITEAKWSRDCLPSELLPICNKLLDPNISSRWTTSHVLEYMSKHF